MMLVIPRAPGAHPVEQRFEIVERKGIGHPDTICDSVAEAISLALVREYREAFGFVPHFNIDKALLVAGSVEQRFGGGRLEEPARLVIGDRATFTVAGRRLQVEEIALEAARSWLAQALPDVDPDYHLRYQLELRPGAAELTRLMDQIQAVARANDTSAAVGYAPLTPTERLVLDTERYLNGGDFKGRFPHTGQDVKVMGVRRDREIALTVAMPTFGRAVPDERRYFELKEEVVADLRRFVETGSQDFGAVDVALNALDIPGQGLDGVYLTLTGTSAEAGDSGQVGRGNGANGLIAVRRPAAAEAAAGKNPFCHVGKIYSVLTHRIAERLCGEVDGVRDATVWLSSRIGSPVDEPHLVAAEVGLAPGATLPDVGKAVEETIRRVLAGTDRFCEELARGEYTVC